MRGFIDYLVTHFGVYFESGSDIFLWFFNRAVAASWLILAVVALRVFLKKAPRFITCALWGICALRLVLPFSLQSALSLIPSAETVVPESIYENRPQIDSGIPIIDENINAQITEQYYEGVSVPQGATLSLTSIIAIIWMLGIIALLTYAVVSYIKLRKCVKGASMLEKGVFESTGVASPFILGVFNPKIYLPLNMDVETKAYVLAHEKAHLSRGDHILKPLGFVLLSLYWFSPLVWVAYILFCRDIELACDERVVSKLEKQSRADYAQALLACAAPKRIISACPLAFGEVSIKDRVKSALHYKKPMLWVIIAAVITAVAIAVCFLTDPLSKKNLELTVTGYNSPLNGISMTLSSVDVNAERPYIIVNWKNDTDNEFTYGEAFSLKRYKNDMWVNCEKGDVFFNEIAYILMPRSSGEHTYYLDGFDISKEGRYRFSTSFNDEFIIDFTLTKTSKEVEGFTDLDTDETTSSLTSSEISKDETSSLNHNSSFISKDPVSNNQSQKTEVNSNTPDTSEKKPENTTTSSKPKEEIPSNEKSEETTSKENEKLDLKYIKYVMLPNNPAPVKVNREDAAVPTPISHTDILQQGETVEFDTNIISYMGIHKLDRYISIIDSYDEFKQIYEKDVEKYNEEYFLDNSVILLRVVDGTYRAIQEIISVTQKDGRMCIYLKHISSGGGYAIGCYDIFVEISDENLKNINDIVVYEEKMSYENKGEIFYREELICRDKLVRV